MMHNSTLGDIFELNYPAMLPEPGMFPREDHRVQCLCGCQNGLPRAEKPAQTKTSLGLQALWGLEVECHGVMGVSVPNWV